MAAFQLSSDTFPIPSALFFENRQRLVSALKGKVPPGAVVLLKGGEEDMAYDTDMAREPFRQESYFFWTYGVREAGCMGLIEVDSGKSTLFPPKLPEDYRTWEGEIHPADWFKSRYEVDNVKFDDLSYAALLGTLKDLNPKKLLLLKTNNSDSNKSLSLPKIKGLESFPQDVDILFPVIAELRVFKTDRELEVLRYVNKIASEAHKAIMKHIQPGYFEYEMESAFKHLSYSAGGCRHVSYICIAPSGRNCSILHYGHANAPNDKKIEDGNMCLFDMGPEYSCYASDVTCSFPANGKFTEKQKIIYNAVLDANLTVFKEAKPGVRWTEMHKLAEKIILGHLKDAGLVVGDVNEMVEARLGGVFMPHGLGHFMGLDTHDVGGYLGDALPRSNLPGLKSLRTTRTLQERMVITIEPGCYFIDYLLEEAYNCPKVSKFLVKEKIAEFRDIGGVRIEDDVVIWSKGNENLTKVPRTVEEIEKFMANRRQPIDPQEMKKNVLEYLQNALKL